MFDMDVQFVGQGGGKYRNDRRDWWSIGDSGTGQRLAAGGAKALASLLHVAFEGLVGIGKN